MDLTVTTTTYGNLDNQDWLASAHGTEEADSVTLDAASLLAAYPSGDIPAGTELSRDTTSGRYEVGAIAGPPANDRYGFLLHAISGVKTGVNPVGALLWHGEVIVAKVPLGAGIVAPVQANHPLIRLV